MDYIEITIAVAAADAERASDVLRAVTQRDVWIETPFTQADLESDAVLSTNGNSLVRGYVDDAADEGSGKGGDDPQKDTEGHRGERTEVGAGSDAGRAIAGRVREALAAADVAGEVTHGRVAEEDWAEAWKEHFHVERFGERVVVVPSWREFTPAAADIVLTLDPGMAFGTGQHETTRMCLEALERRVTAGARVLDLGCGSGILSIAAVKLGAREVVALDIDANCVRITRENARANGVSGVVRASEGTLRDDPQMGTDGHRIDGARVAAESGGAAADPMLLEGFDVVVANIIARVIVDLAAPIFAALAPGGRLIASGIIAAREDEVTVALCAVGLLVESSRTMGEWRCIEAVRA